MSMVDVDGRSMGGAHRDHEAAIDVLKRTVLKHLQELSRIPVDQLLAERYEKFRKVGEYGVAAAS